MNNSLRQPRSLSRPRPVVLHLLNDFRAGAPLSFIIDLARQLKEYYHLLLTNQSAVEVGEHQNELCLKLGLEVRLTESGVIGPDDIKACRPDVVIMYDIRRDEFDLDVTKTFPTVYYGHYTYDPIVARSAEVSIQARVGLDPENQPDYYFPPYVDHSLLEEVCKKPHPPVRKRIVSMLSGRPLSFDFDFAVDFVNGIDPKRVIVQMPKFTGIDRRFDEAIDRWKKLECVLLFPHSYGAAYNAYRRTQMLISTGCFRIDTECGILRRPVVEKPDSVEEAIEKVEKSLENRKSLDEHIDYGRLISSQRRLDLHIHEFNNLVRRLC